MIWRTPAGRAVLRQLYDAAQKPSARIVLVTGPHDPAPCVKLLESLWPGDAARIHLLDDPDGLARVKQSNLDTYGDESGPTPDFLYQKYGSWQAVLEKALGTNAGMDACLGFYDEFFEMYDIGQ